MKQWLETREVLAALAGLSEAGRRAALATVVRVRGSAYRHEGAKMLVSEDGVTTGNVSGGCLEADVREVALGVIASGRPERRSWCAGTDEIAAWDLGVGCEGEVELLIEPARADRAVERGLLESAEPFACCTVLDDPSLRLVVTETRTSGTLGGDALAAGAVAAARGALRDGTSRIHPIDGRDVFVEVLLPPPTLLVLGAGDDARPLAAFGAAIGFRVAVVDHRPALLAPDRFPSGSRLVVATPSDLVRVAPPGGDTYAVVMTHDYARDRSFLGELLATDAPYIGVLGPRQRTERMLAELGVASEAETDRIYGPVGLDIGTDGAEQVAISALSEILSVRSGRRPNSLRERRHPIHSDAGR